MLASSRGKAPRVAPATGVSSLSGPYPRAFLPVPPRKPLHPCTFPQPPPTAVVHEWAHSFRVGPRSAGATFARGSTRARSVEGAPAGGAEPSDVTTRPREEAGGWRAPSVPSPEATSCASRTLSTATGSPTADGCPVW